MSSRLKKRGVNDIPLSVKGVCKAVAGQDVDEINNTYTHAAIKRMAHIVLLDGGVEVKNKAHVEEVLDKLLEACEENFDDMGSGRSIRAASSSNLTDNDKFYSTSELANRLRGVTQNDFASLPRPIIEKYAKAFRVPTNLNREQMTDRVYKAAMSEESEEYEPRRRSVSRSPSRSVTRSRSRSQSRTPPRPRSREVFERPWEEKYGSKDKTYKQQLRKYPARAKQYAPVPTSGYGAGGVYDPESYMDCVNLPLTSNEISDEALRAYAARYNVKVDAGMTKEELFKRVKDVCMRLGQGDFGPVLVDINGLRIKNPTPDCLVVDDTWPIDSLNKLARSVGVEQHVHGRDKSEVVGRILEKCRSMYTSSRVSVTDILSAVASASPPGYIPADLSTATPVFQASSKPLPPSTIARPSPSLTQSPRLFPEPQALPFAPSPSQFQPQSLPFASQQPQPPSQPWTGFVPQWPGATPPQPQFYRNPFSTPSSDAQPSWIVSDGGAAQIAEKMPDGGMEYRTVSVQRPFNASDRTLTASEVRVDISRSPSETEPPSKAYELKYLGLTDVDEVKYDIGDKSSTNIYSSKGKRLENRGPFVPSHLVAQLESERPLGDVLNNSYYTAKTNETGIVQNIGAANCNNLLVNSRPEYIDSLLIKSGMFVENQINLLDDNARLDIAMNYCRAGGAIGSEVVRSALNHLEVVSRDIFKAVNGAGSPEEQKRVFDEECKKYVQDKQYIIAFSIALLAVSLYNQSKDEAALPLYNRIERLYKSYNGILPLPPKDNDVYSVTLNKFNPGITPESVKQQFPVTNASVPDMVPIVGERDPLDEKRRVVLDNLRFKHLYKLNKDNGLGVPVVHPSSSADEAASAYRNAGLPWQTQAQSQPLPFAQPLQPPAKSAEDTVRRTVQRSRGVYPTDSTTPAQPTPIAPPTMQAWQTPATEETKSREEPKRGLFNSNLAPTPETPMPDTSVRKESGRSPFLDPLPHVRNLFDAGKVEDTVSRETPERMRVENPDIEDVRKTVETLCHAGLH